MFVLDTNAVIHFFKNKGQVAEHLLATAPGDIGLPAVVVYELERGVRKSAQAHDRAARLARFIAAVKILPFDGRTASVAAGIAVALESRGEKIGPLDTLIAATAIANDAILVTHNTTEFSRIAELRIEDWYG